MDKWEQLKVWIENQYKTRDGAISPVERLLQGFYKAIKDKMWSLEKKEAKQLSEGENENGNKNNYRDKFRI